MTTPSKRPRHPLYRLIAWILAAAAVGAAAVLAANLFIRGVARPHLRGSLLEIEAPFAIVPGASVHRDGTPSQQLEDRLSAALALVRSGRVERVLVSGARNGAYDEAGPMRRWLTQRGVRPARIVEDHAGFRTLDTMERAARVHGIRRAVVCTQAFHLPRAVFLARRAGIDATGFNAGGDRARLSMNDTVRESFASLMAVIDSYLLNRQPRDARPEPPRGRP